MDFRIDIATISHLGLSCAANEDALLLDLPYAGASMHGVLSRQYDAVNWLVAVADGMGSGNAGAEASRVVVEALGKLHIRQSCDVSDALIAIHGNLLEAGRTNPRWSGLGAAVAGIGAGEDGVFVFNVGDCGAYRVVDGFLQQLSVDDSIGGVLVAAGIAGEGPRQPGQNRLTQVLGGPFIDRIIIPHISAVRLNSPARFLLCTDGLTDMISLEIMEAVTATGAPSDVVQGLLSAALEAGGKDNVTVMVLDVSPVETHNA